MEAFSALFINIDSLGKDFTGAVYRTFAAYLTPVMAGLLVLYLILWGFRFWQGRGDTNLFTMVFKLLRIAIIFAVATQWGPIQRTVTKAIEGTPYFISATMLNKIVNPRNGKAMTLGTPTRDLADIYKGALGASLKIAVAAEDHASSAPPAASAEGTQANPAQVAKKQPALKDSNDPSSVVLSAHFQSALVWIAAALFVGYAAALFLFAKIALWILLGLAPFFIILLIFPVSSRFFAGWLSGIIQTALIPVFLYVFLSFYIFGTYDIIVAFMNVTNDLQAALTMKEVGPFVLFCFTGLFMLLPIIPLTRQIATTSQEWFANVYEGLGGSIRAGMQAGSNALIKGLAINAKGANGAAVQGHFGNANAMETSLREIQERNTATNRQNRNR
ncbi:type IV secretion system protein [Phyllobacterium sp. YR531]|uniref:type IV secretion system protein n=1 Tax=Phyllobacterium sp. YR531 TaxID=1144343 RepID=UPI00026F6CC5|nr:type IV secretion system protein [Phyllobacterium sp. YR531]EJN02777.1 type IV secretory pathway, VirB6 component [Phyllobacterium sp. YR531]